MTSLACFLEKYFVFITGSRTELLMQRGINAQK
jgi:hypothetical protein